MEGVGKWSAKRYFTRGKVFWGAQCCCWLALQLRPACFKNFADQLLESPFPRFVVLICCMEFEGCFGRLANLGRPWLIAPKDL